MPSPPPANAGARLTFRAGAGRTRLAELEQRAPVRVLLPRVPDAEPPQAVLINTGGGLVGGDQVEIGVDIGSGASALVTTQAAEKVYRSAGPSVELMNELTVGDGAWLEWLPQPTILFEGHRLRRATRIGLDGSGRCVLGEILILGRQHHGERLVSGWLDDRIEVRRHGKPLWLDAFTLAGDVRAALDHPFRLRGARALGLLLYVGADAETHLEPVRSQLDTVDPGPLRPGSPFDGNRRTGPVSETWAGATLLPGVLIVRWLGPDPTAIQRSFADVARQLRAAAGGLPPELPTIWSV